jgi:GNAT superfamily N-acetyltransferase
VAWGGLGIPVPLTEEQQKAVKGGITELPPDFNMELAKCLMFHEAIFKKCLQKHGYDPTKHFGKSSSLQPPILGNKLTISLVRQSTMVDTPYQRKGIGRMLTRKCNELADAAGAATYARARPTSKKLFESEGYKVLEEIPMNYEDFGFQGKSAVYVMRREPGGR